VTSNEKNAKLGQKGSCWDHVTQFWNFGRAVSSNGKNAKFRQKGSCGGHVTHFWNFGTPIISR